MNFVSIPPEETITPLSQRPRKEDSPFGRKSLLVYGVRDLRHKTMISDHPVRNPEFGKALMDRTMSSEKQGSMIVNLSAYAKLV